MESGTIVRWLKSEGDAVEKGEPLYELDTEKVTQEVEADASGVLLKIAVAEGEVPVGRTIAVIGAEGEDVPDVKAADTGDGDGAAAAREVEERAEEEGSPAQARDAERERGRRAAADAAERATEEAAGGERSRAVAANGGRLKASPLARRIAREKGVELS